MEKCLIVAIGANNGIGVKGDLPWHIPEDLKYFKSVTSGYPVIMGRTTYFSLPRRPLPRRLNVVLNAGGDPIPEVTCALSFDEAYAAAAASGAEKCFIMGGASVYRAALSDMDTLYITHVDTVVADADAFFPEIDPTVWYVDSVTPTHKDEASGLEYRFAVYKRR